MLVSLEVMDDEEFSRYLKDAIHSYAKNNVKSGRWDDHDAIERSQKAHADLLPYGNNTNNNYLFNVKTERYDRSIGYIWLKVDDGIKAKSAFIYDVEIYEAYRRKGYAKSVLQSIEVFLVDLGVSSLGLHVFNYNSAAISLYESAGYKMVSHNMQKKISVIGT